MAFKFDQPIADVSGSPEGMTFENAPPDLKFSDLGPPPERVETEGGAQRRQAADTEAVWDTTCPSCSARLAGTRTQLTAHICNEVAKS